MMFARAVYINTTGILSGNLPTKPLQTITASGLTDSMFFIFYSTCGAINWSMYILSIQTELDVV